MHKTRLLYLLLGWVLFGLTVFPAPVHAGVGVNPASLSFGSVAVNTTSSAATVVVTNNSGQTHSILQISSGLPQFVVIVPALPITLSPHASASFQVVFQPDAALNYSGSIVLSTSRTSGGSGSPTISVSGTGTSPSPSPSQTYLLSPSASSLSFGNTLVGTSASQPVSLTNMGTGSVNISQVSATGGGFGVSGFSSAVNLAAGQSLALIVSYAPASAVSTTGSLSVVSSATNSPATISLSGKGVQPQINVIPPSVNFFNVAVGVTNTQTLTISNPGTANLSVTQALLGGSGFTFSGLSLPLSVAPGGSSTFTVGFKPPAGSSFSGSLTLVNNSPNSPLIVSLAGTGASPVLQLTPSPSSVSFGSLTTGTSATQSVTLTNTGNSSVSLSQISVSGTGFSGTGLAVPLTLAAGQAASLSAKFAPTTTGNFSGSVNIVSDATNSPLAVSLSGWGNAPASHTVTLGWTPGSSSYAGFNTYRGSVPGGPYSKVNTALISSTSFVDTGVVSGQTYYYVATTVDTTGMESSYSSEVNAIIP